MKNLFVILFISISLISLWAQEPVVIHYNFSFEKEYTYLTNDLNYFTISIFNPNGATVYKRHFGNSEFVRNMYGYCFIADTIKSLIPSKEAYSVNVEYKPVNRNEEASNFSFVYNDTIESLALEIYFDQSKVISTDYEWISFEKFYYDRYSINENPKPVLLVKYLKEGDVSLIPTWFTEYRINPRPRYYLFNGSSSIIKSSGKGFDNNFSGHLQILDSANVYKSFFLGFECGTVGGKNILSAGESEDIVEGFTIGDPQKLKEGFYRYSVGYLDGDGEIKNADSFFRVIYSK